MRMKSDEVRRKELMTKRHAALQPNELTLDLRGILLAPPGERIEVRGLRARAEKTLTLPSPLRRARGTPAARCGGLIQVPVYHA